MQADVPTINNRNEQTELRFNIVEILVWDRGNNPLWALCGRKARWISANGGSMGYEREILTAHYWESCSLEGRCGPLYGFAIALRSAANAEAFECDHL